MAFLEIKNVSKQYANHLALDNVSLDIEKQRVYGLLGPMVLEKQHLFVLSTTLQHPIVERFYSMDNLSIKEILHVLGTYQKSEDYIKK